MEVKNEKSQHEIKIKNPFDKRVEKETEKVNVKITRIYSLLSSRKSVPLSLRLSTKIDGHSNHSIPLLVAKQATIEMAPGIRTSSLKRSSVSPENVCV